jgi:hypothetical protein
MSKRKAVKTSKPENLHTAPVAQDKINQENAGQQQTAAHSIDEVVLGLEQTYGNRYVRDLIESDSNRIVQKDTQDRIKAQKGTGQALDKSTRSVMESKFSRDLGDVQIHTGSEAANLSEDLNAKAFTIGKDIFFADNAYKPNTPEGMKTLRHELTHVLQQAEYTADSALFLTQPSDIAEREASHVEKGGEISATTLPAGAIARGGPTSTPEAMPVSVPPTNEGSPSPTSASPAGPNVTARGGERNRGGSQPQASEQDAARRAALQAMYQTMVVGQVTAAQTLISGGTITATIATQACQMINTSQMGIMSIMASYADKPDIQGQLMTNYNLLVAVNYGLMQYQGIQVPPDILITDLTNSSAGLSAISGSL